jgi:hypothetical protein
MPRRVSRGSRGTLSRYYFSRRTFDDAIEELTEQSIHQSLKEIDEKLEHRFGTVRETRKAAKRPKKEAEPAD